ncbi:MAG: GMC family oxidoreductase N-terminal domain-containing protein, partial [Solirubrobacteraceae bacterium]
MASFDYDVIIIGSGFGGSVAALRAAEKGYRVGVLESGRRWKDEDIPKTQWDLAHFVWFPAAELYGVQRIEYLDDVLVLSGAGVGGGSHVYASTMYVPPKQFFDAPEWAGITDWADELAPYFDQARRMLGVVRYPYMPTDVDRAIKQVANDIGRGETHNKAPLAVYFGTPGVEAEDPYFGGVGPRRTGCISCGNCNNGCGQNAKNKLTTNYLYLAEKLGAQVHDMHEVHDLIPLDGGGFEVHARHPGWAQRAGHLHHNTHTAEQVIVAAHAYGSAKLLHHMQHKGRLTGLSSELGKRARTNSEQLLYITRTHAEWELDRERIHIMPGSVTITSGTWPDPVTSIEPTYWGLGSNVFAFLGTYHQHGEQKHSFESWLKEILKHP